MNEKGEVNGIVVLVISIGLKIFDGIVVDWIYYNIYWIDIGYNIIEVVFVDGFMKKILVDKDLDELRFIVVDLRNGYVSKYKIFLF